ncbi:Carboxyvinyl-carboxyphosphonate phosphorylmutase [Teratosphaeria destructans]|uniref:Carboxyvinyl-carboxyphosphonate phosphorylmutase n=1 Tax=Teratosphaeria destructans TaxID=418781 RepID=A0A9W7W5G0_9PEZI|nr:Carboxyvinyl-carboxyphosphonate phosphorylmutase [Teratosphaeria destructans]
MTTSDSVSGANRLRQILADPKKIVVAPGVYDGITARLALAEGFECLYMTGAGTSMSRLGMADLGLCNFSDMHQNAAMLASINPRVPLIADADTGYGGPINVHRTVTQYARSGVAGLHIEDQVSEKRCGHLSGKLLVSREVYYNRLRAACKARDESAAADDRIVVIARTDARAGKDGEGNGGFNEAVARLTEAAKIGVDVLFFEAIQDIDEAKKVIASLPSNIPVLLNMVPGGRTPVITNKKAQDLGFRIVIWPIMAVEAAVPAVQSAYKHLKTADRTPEDQAQGPGAMFEVCGLKELMAFDESVGGSAYAGA